MRTLYRPFLSLLPVVASRIRPASKTGARRNDMRRTRFALLTAAAGALAALTASIALAAPSSGNVVMLDACDPATFNAAIGDGACERPGGGVSFDTFVGQLLEARHRSGLALRRPGHGGCRRNADGDEQGRRVPYVHRGGCVRRRLRRRAERPARADAGAGVRTGAGDLLQHRRGTRRVDDDWPTGGRYAPVPVPDPPLDDGDGDGQVGRTAPGRPRPGTDKASDRSEREALARGSLRADRHLEQAVEPGRILEHQEVAHARHRH